MGCAATVNLLCGWLLSSELEQISQSRPDSGLGLSHFQYELFKPFKLFPQVAEVELTEWEEAGKKLARDNAGLHKEVFLFLTLKARVE